MFARSAGEWALVVGDVSGKGAEAAAATALARYTLRAAALEPVAASEALRRLNTMMLADDSSQFATVVLAYVSAADGGGMAARVALGGHPPPLILRADGARRRGRDVRQPARHRRRAASWSTRAPASSPAT